MAPKRAQVSLGELTIRTKPSPSLPSTGLALPPSGGKSSTNKSVTTSTAKKPTGISKPVAKNASNPATKPSYRQRAKAAADKKRAKTDRATSYTQRGIAPPPTDTTLHESAKSPGARICAEITDIWGNLPSNLIEDRTYFPRENITNSEGEVQSVPIDDAEKWPLPLLEAILKFAKKIKDIITEEEVLEAGLLCVRECICDTAILFRRAINQVPEGALEYGLLVEDVEW